MFGSEGPVLGVVWASVLGAAYLDGFMDRRTVARNDNEKCGYWNLNLYYYKSFANKSLLVIIYVSLILAKLSSLRRGHDSNS
jgi:hypothetical protein